MSLNGGMCVCEAWCMHVSYEKEKESVCNQLLTAHRCVERVTGCSGGGNLHYQLGKSGRDEKQSGQENDKSAKQQRQIPPVSACSLM